jgi:hypothetical protein
MGGLNKLLSHYAIPVYARSNENIQGMTILLKEADVIEIVELQATFKVFKISGHTSEHIVSRS